jgi:hypothetical protein
MAVAATRDQSGSPAPVRTFARERETNALSDCVLVLIGVIALALAHVREDYSLVAIALEVPVLVAIYVALCTALSRPWKGPSLDSVEALPPGSVVEARRMSWTLRIVVFLALALLTPYMIFGDASTLTLLGSIVLASPINNAIRRRALGRWEDEHDLELLRERRERRGWRDRSPGSSRLYVRPRTPSVTEP